MNGDRPQNQRLLLMAVSSCGRNGGQYFTGDASANGGNECEGSEFGGKRPGSKSRYPTARARTDFVVG